MQVGKQAYLKSMMDDISDTLGNEIFAICTRLQEAQTSKQVRDLASEAVLSMGWESWVYVSQVAVRMAQSTSALFSSNFSLLWLAEYKFRNYYQIDPVVDYVMTHDQPYVWTPEAVHWRDATPEAQSFMGRIRDRGFAGGVGIPVHTLVTRGFLNVVTALPFDQMEQSIRNAQIYGLLIGNNIHDALYRIQFPDRGRLSEMQIKVLQWVAEGASAEVVADKLGIKVPTVLYHIIQAQKKLKIRNIGAKNRQELIMKAYAMGYLNSVMNWDDDSVLNAPELTGKLSEIWEKEVKPELAKKKK